MPKFLEMLFPKVKNQPLFAYAMLLCLPLASYPATAQIIPDNTLPNNSVVAPDAANLTTGSGIEVQITGGTTVGNNLFHSFQEFSLPQSNIASFDNLGDIQNILTRVTGSNISNIDGLINAGGSANLFFVNPNGIVLGENAALNIGGSFIGSTANSIVFQDGSEFSAVNPGSPPMLTINAPAGLNMGGNAGEITVNGSGNNIYYDWDNYAPATGDRPIGFAVDSGQTLSLIGNGISLAGGNITAEQGRIELGSVDRAGTVSLEEVDAGWTLNYQNIDTFGDINLTQAASVDASGNSGGTVQLTGKNISLADGSVVLVETLGDGEGGLLNVQATDTVELIGENPDTFFWTSFLADTVMDSTGNGGSIAIATKNLDLIDGGQITSVIYGEGNGGNIDIEAENTTISGFNDDGTSGIYTSAEWTSFGIGGNIVLNTQNLELNNEGQIGALAWGEGDAGDVNIDARQILVTEFALISANADEFSFGNGGDVNINAQDILLNEGGQIAASTFADGDGGNVNINADRIELSGASDPTESFDTAIAAGSRGDAIGNAGNIEITATDLILKNGAQLNSATTTPGNGGNIVVNADNIELSGFQADSKSGFVANALIDSGNGGDINVTTDNLSIKDGALITVSNFSTRNPDLDPGPGIAGDINIQAKSINLDSSLVGEQSSITASTFAAGGGNIILDTDSIAALNNSQVTAETQGEGDGGTIQLSAKNIDLESGALFSSKTNNSGDGGTISLTSDSLDISSQAEISTSSTGLGQAGNINVDSNKIKTNEGSITATSEQSGGGDINLTSDSIQLKNNSLISTSVLDSNGGGGNITIDNSNLILARNDSDIRANAVFGPGGNIEIATELIFTDLTSDIDASSKFGLDGVVEIKSPESDKELNTAILPENIENPTGLISASCPISDENTFAVIGNGGVPNSPYQTQSLNTTWYDLRPVKPETDKVASIPAPITEATATMINADGELELVALTPLSTHRWINSSCSN